MTTDDAPEPPLPAAPDADPVAVVVLAAGHGIRMRSPLPKPLHPVAGLPMVEHVLRAAGAARPASTVLVVGPEAADLAARLGRGESLTTVVQDPPRGTGDAARLGLAAAGGAPLVVVLFADHPLLTGDAVARLVAGARRACARVTALTCLVHEAGAYGRLARDAAGRPLRIVEAEDDDPGERADPTEINSGMMALDAGWARAALDRLRPSSASGELYLTDLVELAVADGSLPGGDWPVAAVGAEPEVALGINDRAQLAAADAIARDRIRRRLLAEGVTLVGQETIFVDAGVRVGPDTTILPFTCLLGSTTVGARCEIGPGATIVDSRLGDGVAVRASTIEGSTIADGSDVGPYSHLRPGTELGPGVHVGNFAELKNARVGEGVMVGHVSYLGDADVGAGANIGAGTITANWDGVAKHRTEIGEGAFVGVDTMLVAPVRLGAGARSGAGSVVTRDVPDRATVVGVPARVIRRGDGAAPAGAGEAAGSGEGGA